ncbi:MAG: SDR family NAD(P)-dependent oxidoreductase [Saprospiraceae bacterium]
MSTIHLVYAPENLDLAEQVTRDIGRIGLPFRHITVRADEPPGQLAAQAEAADGPVLFLLTDNFLKNSACMANALAMFRTLSNRNGVLTVVADGRHQSADGRSTEPVPTRFDRVVHAIQYMNYWQTIYLERTDRLSSVPLEQREQCDRDLEVIRGIANELGDLFSALREAGYITWPELLADDYARFFGQFNLRDWHEQYRRLATLDHEAPPPPVIEIAHPVPVAQAPAFAGPLVPQYAEAELPHSQEELLVEEGPIMSEQDIRQAVLDARFWLERGHTDRGIDLFRTLIEQNPHNETLQTEYRRALEQFNPNGTLPLESPTTSPETSIPEISITAPPEPATQQADSYNAMGDNALAKGDYLLAKYCWDRVTDHDPHYPGIYRKLAVLTCDHLTDYRETAAYYLEEAIAIEPETADLHYRLAMLLRDHLDQPAKARQHLGDVVVLQPDHAQAWLALARFSLEANDQRQAESLYRHTLSLDPSLQSDADDALFHSPIHEPPAHEPAPPAHDEPAILQPSDPQPPHTGTLKPETLTVLITGATSGIGRATAELFARNGHRLVITGRREERLDALRQQFADEYQNNAVLSLTFDVRDAAAVAEQIESLPEEWQDIDVLVNNAGLAKGLAPIHEGQIEHWETMIDTNIKGLLYVTRAVSPGMVRRRRGHIINIGSSAGKEVYPNGNVYCATKFAVDALTRGMRMDLYAHNVRVSQVSPGHTEETEFALTRFDGDAERAKIYNDFRPLRAADVAEAVYFAATRPPHVNVQDIWLFPSQQAASTMIDRSGR